MTGLIKKIAIEKCDRRMQDAIEALDQCKAAKDYDAFVKAWTLFLIAASSVPHILERAAGATPQGRQWYGGKRREGRSDPLVLYMYQARNAEEHGIEPVTERDPGAVLIGRGGGVMTADVRIDESGRVFVGQNRDGSMPHVQVIPPHVKLVTVHDDRYKQSFEPPREHKGKPIDPTTPTAAMEIASLYLNYVSELVSDAEALS